jgi:NAD-dependent deacetylase
LTESDLRHRLAGRVLALTGAGISAASGLPTFRGDGGLYEGLNPYELATPEAFRDRPTTVWNWYALRIRQGLEAKPNAAHHALARLETLAQRCTVVTSNVDPLHRLAGSQRVFRLHGDILQTLCTRCRSVDALDVGALADPIGADALPRCGCGGLLRPNVVWFGERPWAEAFDAVRSDLPDADLVMEVGSSGVVSYGFVELAVRLGIGVLRINPEGKDEPGIHLIAQPAEVVLPALVEGP